MNTLCACWLGSRVPFYPACGCAGLCLFTPGLAVLIIEKQTNLQILLCESLQRPWPAAGGQDLEKAPWWNGTAHALANLTCFWDEPTRPNKPSETCKRIKRKELQCYFHDWWFTDDAWASDCHLLRQSLDNLDAMFVKTLASQFSSDWSGLTPGSELAECLTRHLPNQFASFCNHSLYTRKEL